METDEVTRLIQKAFPLKPIPKMTLHQAQLADQTMTRKIPEREWNDAGKRDAGRTWQDLIDEEIVSCDAALSHFDEPSFVYYLPAYLLFARTSKNLKADADDGLDGVERVNSLAVPIASVPTRLTLRRWHPQTAFC